MKSPAEQRQQLCKYFKRGSCKKGQECAFSHDLARIMAQKNEKYNNNNYNNNDSGKKNKGKQKQKQQSSSGSSSSSDDDDDDDDVDSSDGDSEDELNRQTEFLRRNRHKEGFDVKFLQVLDMIKRNDPKLHDEKVKSLFDEGIESDINDDDGIGGDGEENEEHARKRQQLVKNIFGEEGSGDDNESIELNSSVDALKRAQKLAELEFNDDNSSESDYGDNDDEDDFLRPKRKTKEELEAEEREYEEFKVAYDAEKRDESARNAVEQALFGDRSELELRGLKPEERFLRQYILNNGWISAEKGGKYADETDDGGMGIPTREEVEEAEAELDMLDEYEDKIQQSSATLLADNERNKHNFAIPKDIIAEFSERRQKLSRRKMRRMKQSEKEKQQKKDLEEKLNERRNLIKEHIIELIGMLKPMIKGDGSAVDRLSPDPSSWDWDKHIETNTIVEELLYAGMNDMDDDDDDEEDMEDVMRYEGYDALSGLLDDDNSDEMLQPLDKKNLTTPRAIRRMLRNKFDFFYNRLHHEDMLGGMEDTTTTRFKYKRVEKEDYGDLTAEDILNMDEEELDRIIPAALTFDEVMEQKKTLEEGREIKKRRSNRRAKPSSSSSKRNQIEDMDEKDSADENKGKNKKQSQKKEKKKKNNKFDIIRDSVLGVAENKATLDVKKNKKRKRDQRVTNESKPLPKEEKKVKKRKQKKKKLKSE